MPELPEVETVRNELLPHVVGRQIEGVTLVWEGIVKEPSPEEFCSRIRGQTILGIKRRGKYLMVALSSGDYLIIHLKMSGALIVLPEETEPPKYTRAIIHLDKGKAVFFRDPRKFGMMKLVADVAFIEEKLGPEPLEDDFTAAVLGERLAGRKAPIKALLLDQKLLAGVGNMYADEALYAARINPYRHGGSLTKREVGRLHGEIRRILWAAIENRGASVDTYFRPDGSTGTAHYEFKVAHGLGGDTCAVCGGPIKRVVIGGRGTYFCPKCQKMKKAAA
jgi:formamidopyrimidine-DNA glycosylase